ncbi:MAG: hypothetical protein FWE31_04055 [Firmicutes bacterium]|nr:hypothetical protein [Bacillota bacterium]
MFHELFRGKFCGCHKDRPQTGSCDILWIIILLLILFNGGLFGIDICTMIILAIVFGGLWMVCGKKKPGCHERPCH